MNATIIITTRNEKWLKWTVDNIHRTCDPKEVIIVYDGLQAVDEFDGSTHIRTPWTTPQGVGKCRHLGIEKATSDYIVLIDAHMDFADGWLPKMIDDVESNHKSIVCSKSVKIMPPYGMKRPGEVLQGAFIREIGAGTGQPLEVEWGENPCKTGPIQCCLGACYAMKRARYYEIGQPWRRAFGWGSSEQTICMVNELCGGVNILSEAETGHYYMKKDQRSFKPDADFKTGAVFNRLRLIRLFYGEDDPKYKPMAHLTIQRSKFRPYAEKALELLNLTDDTDIISLFEVSKDEYAAKWWAEQEVKPVEKKQIKYVKRDIDERFV